jgi:hypothetical protein
MPEYSGIFRLGEAVESLDETHLAFTVPGDGGVSLDCCEYFATGYLWPGPLPPELTTGAAVIRGVLNDDPDIPSIRDIDTRLGAFAYIAPASNASTGSSIVIVDDTGNPYLYGNNARLFDTDALGGDALTANDAHARFPLEPAPMQLARCGDLTGDGIEDLCTTDGVYAGPLSETPVLTTPVTTDAVAACPDATASPGMFVKDGDAIHFVQTIDDLMNRDLSSPMFTATGDLLDWVCAGDRVLALLDGALVSFDQTSASSVSTDYIAIERANTGDLVGLALSGRVDVFRADDPATVLRSLDTEDGAHTMALYDADGDGAEELVIGYPDMEHEGMVLTSGALLTLYGW